MALAAGAADAQENGAAGSWGSGDAGGNSGGWSATPEAGTMPGFEPEKQVATGKFLTALEVKPILAATVGNWVALRDYGGQDLLYFTHLLAWRCGLFEIRYAVNGGPEQVFEAEPCYIDTNAPAAIKTDRPYLTFPPGSVQEVAVHLIYDDATDETQRFPRKAILMP